MVGASPPPQLFNNRLKGLLSRVLIIGTQSTVIETCVLKIETRVYKIGTGVSKTLTGVLMIRTGVPIIKIQSVTSLETLKTI